MRKRGYECQHEGQTFFDIGICKWFLCEYFQIQSGAIPDFIINIVKTPIKPVLR